MVWRNLLYTGITWPRRLIVLVGTKRARAIAVKNDKTVARFTNLRGSPLRRRVHPPSRADGSM
jgi:exodeoxyribonuclease V alpha subunit